MQPTVRLCVNLPLLPIPKSVKQAALPTPNSHCSGESGTAIILITSIATAVMGNAALCVSEGFSPLSGIRLGRQWEVGERFLLSLWEAKTISGNCGLGCCGHRPPNAIQKSLRGAKCLVLDTKTSLRAQGKDRRVMRVLRP